MKKILSALLVAALLFTMAGMTASANPTDLIWSLSTSAQAVNSTQTFDLTIKLDQNPGMASQYFDVKFDTNDLEYVPVTGQALTRKYYLGDTGFDYTSASEFLQSEFINEGIVRWIGATSTNKSSVGDFMYLTFKVKTTAKKATSISLQFSAKDTTAAPAVTGNPPILLTYNQPSVPLYLNGYVPVVKYALTYDKNTTDEVTGMPEAAEYEVGAAVDLSARPQRAGYTCKGWSTDGTTVLTSFNMPATATTLLAVWELIPAEKFVLTYDKNNTKPVTGIPDPVEYEEGEAVDLSATPASEGYTFKGWSTDKTNILGNLNMPAANTTVYAVWELVTHEVIVDPATSTKEGLKEVRDFWGNFISSEPIAKLPHFGTLKGIQEVRAGAKLDDETTTIRLVLGINSLEYVKAGFIVAAQSNLNKDGFTPGDEFSKEVTSKTVYTTLTTGGKTYKASDFGADYLVVIEIANFPKAAYGHDVRFQGFAVTADGEYHFDAKTITKVATLIG